MPLEFHWDRGKARRNLVKHKVGFEEALTAFADPLSSTIPDTQHSTLDEQRFVILGASDRGRLLVVVHLDVGDGIRIISARRATRRERKDYEEDA